jgi:DNA-binding XRE family transcriptional regulator
MRPNLTRLEVSPMCEHAKISARRAMYVSPQSVAVSVNRNEVDDEEIDIGGVIRANLLKLRLERGLSLGELAELSGASLSTLEDLASGKSFPSVELLWKLGRVFDVPCTAFIEESEMSTLLSAPSNMRSTFA